LLERWSQLQTITVVAMPRLRAAPKQIDLRAGDQSDERGDDQQVWTLPIEEALDVRTFGHGAIGGVRAPGSREAPRRGPREQR
jgi:hypothetical protein